MKRRYSKDTLLLFKSSREVMKAEEALEKQGLDNCCVPVPAKYSKDCGAAIEVDAENSAAAAACLLDRDMDRFRMIFRDIQDTYAENNSTSGKLPLPESGGCSAKMAPADLDTLLSRRFMPPHPALQIGPDSHDDGGIIETPGGEQLVQTVDFFTPVVEDPYIFGQIAAANALSDIYAMGGRPLSALAIVAFSISRLPVELLELILLGGVDKLSEAGAAMAGGHTIDDHPPKYGLAVTGTVKPEHLMSNDRACPGDVIVLTKPLGTGLVLAGYRIEASPEAGQHLEAASESMIMLNRAAAGLCRKYNVRCATDITGFGLGGHALKMARASDVSMVFRGSSLPALPGAREYANMACVPGAAMRNLAFISEHTEFANNLTVEDKWLFLDPQTSGGLMISLPPDRADSFISECRAYDIEAAVIGDVVDKRQFRLFVEHV